MQNTPTRPGAKGTKAHRYSTQISTRKEHTKFKCEKIHGARWYAFQTSNPDRICDTSGSACRVSTRIDPAMMTRHQSSTDSAADGTEKLTQLCQYSDTLPKNGILARGSAPASPGGRSWTPCHQYANSTELYFNLPVAEPQHQHLLQTKYTTYDNTHLRGTMW
jgi:hypothetical protein